MASTRKSFFGAAGMRASIAKDGEETGSRWLLETLACFIGLLSEFAVKAAPKLVVECNARESHYEREVSPCARLQIPGPQILLLTLECLEHGGSRRTHLSQYRLPRLDRHYREWHRRVQIVREQNPCCVSRFSQSH